VIKAFQHFIPRLLPLALTISIGSAAFADDQYPRISAMETALLGATYPAQPLAQRLGRLEQKAFGKSDDKGDLSDRTDKLQDYVEKTTKKPLIAPGADYEDAQTDDDQAPNQSTQPGQAQQSQSGSASQNDYPRVTALEQANLGQSYTSEALADRLSRMEQKAFGNAMPQMALGDRTDALEDYAEKKLHKKILGQSSPVSDYDGQDGGTAGSAGGGGGSLLAKVGSALFGLPAPGQGNGPSFAVPGFGAFGGVRVRPRSAVISDQESQADNEKLHQDDAIINSPDMPKSTTRLLTKVGWCEKRVFGQVYYDKHLPERLALLNDTLKFDPGKRGVDLMDDVDGMMKAAQARKPVGAGN